MIVVDQALERREAEGRPVRVGLVGAGYMGRGIALQILTAVPGMRLAAVSNRHVAEARTAYETASEEPTIEVSSTGRLEDAISRGQHAVTEDAMLLARAGNVDVLIEATGTIEFGARVVMEAIRHSKHVVLMNAELDATLGPILKVHADRAGVVITNADGDQPGVIMNLLRFVRSIGLRPVLAGNMKGLQDPYRTPATQEEYARKHNQKPRMVTAFADGTKISMEMAVVANATGFRAGQRGMYGPRCDDVREAAPLFPREQLLDGGIVDYVLGAEPAGGVFVIGHEDDRIQRQYLHYYKMGDGPFYVFHTPYHLCHFEAPLTAARAALFDDAAIAPGGGPVCEVITVAKQDLPEGTALDGIGGFHSYGVLDNAEPVNEAQLLPMGLSEGCTLRRAVSQDRAITYDDVVLPDGRYSDELRAEQLSHFADGPVTTPLQGSS